ncbi:type IV secretory pathway TrbL component [Bradyrhizobium sp. RT6a]
MMGFTSFFAVAVLMVSWLLVLIAFFILAVQLFVTLIEFKLTTLAGFILIPFALFNKTAFLAEKVLGNVVASGVKVMVLAVIGGIGAGLSRSSPPPMAAASRRSSGRFLSCSPHSPCSAPAPGIANGLFSGAPQLGAGAAVGTSLAVAGTAMAGGASLALAGRGAMAAASGAAAAERGGAAMAGGVSSPYSLASAGRSSAGRVASGFSGAGRAAASAVAAPVRRAAEQATGAMQESFASGARASFANTGGSSTMGVVEGGEAARGSRFPRSERGLPAWV